MQNQQNLLDDQGLYQQSSYSHQQTVKTVIPLIYSWGRNQQGELAVKQSIQNIINPTPAKNMKGFAKQIVSARSHSALLNHQGQVYMCGSLLFGRLGMKATVNNFRQFKLLKQPMKFVKIACGDFHTLALTDKGAVYSWGGSLWDKTGHKTDGVAKIQRLAGRNIIDIACGDFHSVAIDDEGRVYSWGGGGVSKNKGQLGHSNKKDISHPQQIEFFKKKKIVKIACGDYHTMVMTSEDQIYAFGQGTLGQLGTGGKQDCSTPKKVLLNFQIGVQEYFKSNLNQKTTIQQIALGGKHSLFLTNKGHLYACGFCSQGQLGLGQGITQNKYEPTLIKSLLGKKIIMVAAGSNHSLALTSKFDVFVCGLNSKGQLGIGQAKSCTIWTHVTALSHKKVCKIYAGGQHSWAVIDQKTPLIQNYEPPSPIRLAMDYNTMIKQNDNYSRQQKNSLSGNSVDEILIELNSNRKLELILTEVQMSHRFIHFVVKDNARNFKKKIDEYLKYMLETQKQIKCHKVSQDGEITDQKGQIKLPANPKGCTIMLVSSFIEQSKDNQNYNPNLPSNNSSKNKIAIGDLLTLDSSMLKSSDGKIPYQNVWFFKFCDIFDDILQKVRFIELRPSK